MKKIGTDFWILKYLWTYEAATERHLSGLWNFRKHKAHYLISSSNNPERVAVLSLSPANHS